MANIPVTIQQLVGKSKLSELKTNSRFVFWLEADSTNNNRQFLNCYYEGNNDSKRFRLTSSSSFNIKSSINEYGGGSYWLDDSRLYFYNKDNYAVYTIKINDIVECYKISNNESFSAPKTGDAPSKNIINLQIKKLTCTSGHIEGVTTTYADGVVTDNGFISVKEVITEKSTSQQLVYCDLNNDTLHVLDEQHEFYSFPRLNPSGNKLLWLSWEHPFMPWDENFLCCAQIDFALKTLQKKLVLIKNNSCSLYQPEWYNDDNVFIVSDERIGKIDTGNVYNLREQLIQQVSQDKTKLNSDTKSDLSLLFDESKSFWNLYLFNINNKQYTNIISGEFDLGLPLWQLSSNTYTFSEPSRIYLNAMKHRQSMGFERTDLSSLTISFYLIKNAKFRIGTLDMIISSDMEITDKKFEIKTNDFVFVQDNISYLNDSLYFLGSTKYKELSCIKYDLDSNESSQISDLFNEYLDKKHTSNISHKPNLINVPGVFFNKPAIKPDLTISTAENIVFTNNLGLETYAFFYKPQCSSSLSEENSKPPLIVMCHGGPTGTTNVGLNYKIQFWTSRGFAVVDVNYSGSTSYGRNYRDRIKNNWGIIDVADCAAAAESLIKQNLVDKCKIFIRGTSAGGLVVLTALYKYDVFTAGVAYFPVSDLTAFSDQTHNFEKFYNNYLIGDYNSKSAEYISRSPISFADKIAKPVLLLHGTADNVIPVEHSQKLYKLLNKGNSLNKYIEFDGEGHGFRSLAAISGSIQAELDFYQKVSLLHPN